MIVKTIPVGLFQCNCVILGDPQTKQAIVVDPGDEAPRILEELRAHDLTVTAIVHTHAHIDHINATFELSRITQAPTYLHQDDTFLVEMIDIQAQMLGWQKPVSCNMQHTLTENQTFHIGSYELGVLHTPGHTPGSVCFHVPEQNLCLSGDTLFRRSVGRTDLWGGDADLIKRSISQKLYQLHNATRVICGHGPDTSIDEEKNMNPFVSDKKIFI